jgi:hypothetical protein
VDFYKWNGREEWCKVCFKLGACNKDLDTAKVCAVDAMFRSVLLGPILSGNMFTFFIYTRPTMVKRPKHAA